MLQINLNSELLQVVVSHIVSLQCVQQVECHPTRFFDYTRCTQSPQISTISAYLNHTQYIQLKTPNNSDFDFNLSYLVARQKLILWYKTLLRLCLLCRRSIVSTHPWHGPHWRHGRARGHSRHPHRRLHRGSHTRHAHWGTYKTMRWQNTDWLSQSFKSKQTLLIFMININSMLWSGRLTSGKGLPTNQ